MTVWNPTEALQHVYCFVQCSLVLGTLFDTSSLLGLWNAVSESKKKADLKWLCKQSFRAQLHFRQQEIETTSRAIQRWQYLGYRGFFTFKSLKKQQKLRKMYKFWQQKLMEGLDLNLRKGHSHLLEYTIIFTIRSFLVNVLIKLLLLCHVNKYLYCSHFPALGLAAICGWQTESPKSQITFSGIWTAFCDIQSCLY